MMAGRCFETDATRDGIYIFLCKGDLFLGDCTGNCILLFLPWLVQAHPISLSYAPLFGYVHSNRRFVAPTPPASQQRLLPGSGGTHSLGS